LDLIEETRILDSHALKSHKNAREKWFTSNAPLPVAPQNRSRSWAVSSLLKLERSRHAVRSASYHVCEAFNSCTDLFNVQTDCWVAEQCLVCGYKHFWGIYYPENGNRM